MREYLLSNASFLFELGFLETKAYLYVDIIVTYLAFLPFLVICSIVFASNSYLRLHQFLQVLLFLSTLIILGSFAYFIHYYEGFNNLVAQTSFNHEWVLYTMSFHIAIALLTMITWLFTIVYAIQDRRRRALPGVYSGSHKRSGRRVLLSIFLTSASGITLYWMLFTH